jgi:hypothetical protein
MTHFSDRFSCVPVNGVPQNKQADFIYRFQSVSSATKFNVNTPTLMCTCVSYTSLTTPHLNTCLDLYLPYNVTAAFAECQSIQFLVPAFITHDPSTDLPSPWQQCASEFQSKYLF